MPRSKKRKMVSSPPLYRSFKPTGVRRGTLKCIMLEIGEYEAIKLADYEGLDHSRAAAEMEISRPTFSRLIERARGKIARFIIDGMEMMIEGGNIHFRDNVIKCRDCGHMYNISIHSHLKNCPQCGSSELFNYAGSFGHGRCCEEIRESEADHERKRK